MTDHDRYVFNRLRLVLKKLTRQRYTIDELKKRYGTGPEYVEMLEVYYQELRTEAASAVRGVHAR